MIRSVKGTRDILNVQLLDFLLATTRAHLKNHAYHEIITPLLEYAELFERSVGETTDIVNKEMFMIQTRHESDDAPIVLRPEITASIMRIFLQQQVSTPWKVFTYGPVFRHERPQKGRYREFYQISIEMIGSNSPYNDALFLCMLDRLFAEKLKLDQYALLINFLGCKADRQSYRKLLYNFVQKHAEILCQSCKDRKDRNILRVLDCKNAHDKELYKNAPHIEQSLCSPCTDEWNLIKTMLHMLSVSYSVAPHLVRGLDYYSKLVFEFVEVGNILGSQNTFCAGGRYDSLATMMGASQDFPSIGAAIGVDRTLLLLESLEHFLPLSQSPRLQVIIPLSEEEKSLALQIADMLYAQDFCADIMLEEGSLKSMLRKANKMNAKTALIIGSQERETHTVTVKNLVSGSEETIPQIKLIDHLNAL